MARIVLDQWDAVELFCRILVKFTKDEVLTLEKFYSSDFLLDMIDQYTRGEKHTKITIEIFGEKSDKNKNLYPNRPKAFYELTRKIKHNEPAVIPDVEYRGFMKYVGLSSLHFQHRKTAEWRPHVRRMTFEDTKWILYYLHQDVKDRTNPATQPSINGVATAILELKHFGKAIITGFKSSECYDGKFDVYDEDGKFIKLRMTLKDHNTKDLSALFYVGTDIPKLCLGQYNNHGRSIYSGTMMLEPIAKSDENKKIPSFYFDDTINVLPQHVQDYFSDKTINMLRVPCKVTSLPTFITWKRQYEARKIRNT